MNRRSNPSLRSRIIGAAGLLLLVLAGVAGWRWWGGLSVTEIRVQGQEVAAETDLLALARIDPGMPLRSVDPTITADRIRRHPWVREAQAARQPTGEVLIDVTERVPVALALDTDGDPAYYLDRFGYRMPFLTGHDFDVPLLRGIREPYRATVPAQSEQLLLLLETLAELDPDIDALVSEFRFGGADGLSLTTIPTPTGRALQARLGDAHFTERLERLHAFWHQAVLPRTNTRFDWIDLRFDSQIVTREHA